MTDKQNEISQALHEFIVWTFQSTSTLKEKFYDLWINPEAKETKNNVIVLAFNNPSRQVEKLQSFLYNRESWSSFLTYLRDYHITLWTTREKIRNRIGPNGSQENLTEELRKEAPTLVSQT